MSDQDSEFTYIFGEKDELLLVLFQGKMNSRVVPILEQCETDLKSKTHNIVIFVFRDVPIFLPGPHINFTKIQKVLRDTGKLVGICSLKPEIRKTLLALGVLRESEIFNNIPEAWKSLKSKFEDKKPNFESTEPQE